MNKHKKRLFIIIGAVVIIALIIILNIIFKEPGTPVESVIADYGTIVSKVTGDGQLKAKAQVNIQSQVMGTVEKLYVKEGDKVKKGQLLCQLDQTSVKADLASAQAQYEQTEKLFLRSESLYLANLISPQEYEQAKANYQTARSRFEQAQDRFAKTTIIAPISGTVTQLNVEQGETVIIGTMNNLGTVLMVIADLTRMLGIITIDETEVPDVKIGAESHITIEAFPDSTFSGKVSKVGYMPKQTATSSFTEPSTDFEVEIELEQVSPNFRPGMSINAEIITSKKDSILIIPIQAIGRRRIKGEETQTAFIIEKGVAKLVPIKTGISDESNIEITDGIKAGDVVITGPYKVLSKLKDGEKVKTEVQIKEKKGQQAINPFGVRRQVRRISRRPR